MIKRLTTRHEYLALFAVCVLVLDAIAAIRYLSLLKNGSPLVVRLAPDFFFVFALTVVLSALAPFIRKQKHLVPILVVNAVFILLIGIPLSHEPSIRLILLALAILELEVYVATPTNWLIALAVIGGAVLLQREVFVWSIRLDAPTSWERVESSALLGGAAFAGVIFRTLLDRMTALLEHAASLEMTVSRLIIANREFQDYAQSVGQAAEREERMRVSRDIHDTVGYTLTNLIVMMESVTDFSRVDPDKAECLLEQARELAIKGLEDTRSSLRLLRSVDAEKPGGLRMIQKLIDTFARATGIDIGVEYGNLPWNLGEDLDEAIYHIVQESLINAFRHGRATSIRIMFWLAESGLKMSITDNGRGAKGIKEGIGFQGIQERLDKFGGTFRAGNTEAGFGVAVSIPVAHERMEAV